MTKGIIFKLMKKLFVLLCFFSLAFQFYAKPKDNVPSYKKTIKPSYHQKKITGEPVQMNEVWGWVMQSRFEEFDNDYPLTDVGFFAADVDSYGNLSNIPDRTKLSAFPGRVHLVIVCDSKSLTHFVLDPSFGLTDKMIKDIMKATEPFDGLNVDYELIPGKDSENFLNFLKKLSKECKKAGKMFSVCVPARIKTISDDIFPYKKIAEISDRVMIMAYDEHWSTSQPGPIASMNWCKKIADYAVTVIPEEKLVMGLPFYGRSWANEKPAQAWYFEGANRIINEYNSDKVRYINDIPNVNLTMKVKVNLWFEDSFSVVSKMRMYKDCKINKIAFWRIGQEDKNIWNYLKINEDSNKIIEFKTQVDN